MTAGKYSRCGRRPRIYLRGRRMKRVRDIDIVSGTVTVQSGISMRGLHEVLAERTFTTGFPTRPWRDESLGAVLAAALDAHWGPRFGSMEEHVVGLGAILPDGTVAYSRNASRKAVGPDFDRLFLGSRGRFGIIYEATLRIFPTASRVVLCYAAADLQAPLEAVRRAFRLGIEPRAVEILTPAPDRSWGRKRVGLTDERPVLVLVEPWGPESGPTLATVDQHFCELLGRLEPPVGWDVHDGLLPPPRAWNSPVVGVPWSELARLARDLGRDVPPGLWLVRMSRQGAWVGLSDAVGSAAAERVRAVTAGHQPAGGGAWDEIAQQMKDRLDPTGILNPD